MLLRGNYKSARSALITADPEKAIDKEVERYTKICATHDCSFPGSSGLPVKNWVMKYTLHPSFNGFFLLRILHMIASMRIKWNSKPILIGETDLDTAYRRVNADAQIVAKCIAIIEKIAFFMSAPALWYHTRTRRIYRHQGGRNQPWEQSLWRYVMGRYKPTVAPPTLISEWRLPAYLLPTSQGRPAHSGYRGKGGLNLWIHWGHIHHHHLRTTLGELRQECSFIDYSHHIQTSAVWQTPEMRWPSLTPKTCRRRSAFQAQYLSGLVHPD